VKDRGANVNGGNIEYRTPNVQCPMSKRATHPVRGSMNLISNKKQGITNVEPRKQRPDS
jgi:hypothetical protein